MTRYTALLLYEGGQQTTTIEVRATNDEDALVEVTQIHEPRSFQLWVGERLVGSSPDWKPAA